MERKKIFIEAQRLFRKQKHGMDVVALELIQRIKKINTPFDVVLLVKNDGDECIQSENNLFVQKIKNAFYPIWEQRILPKFIRKHSHSWLHCTGNTAPIWGKNPLLLTVHDLIFLEENYLFKKNGGSLYQRFGNFYRRLIVPIAARRAKHIITVSEFQRQLIMKKLKISADKISVVYNGADERFFMQYDEPTIQTVKHKYGLDNAPYIFFMANTEPRKNTDGVIKAFAFFCNQYPEYSHKLVIKGLTDEQLEKKIATCGALAVADRIHRVGYIDYNDLPVIYQGASMLWFPSFSEGFGLPIVEAMAGGTPVITSNVSVMPEIGGDAALYINPDNYKEIAVQTASLLKNTTLKNDLIERGKKRALNFTWGNSVKNLLQIYEKMLS